MRARGSYLATEYHQLRRFIITMNYLCSQILIVCSKEYPTRRRQLRLNTVFHMIAYLLFYRGSEARIKPNGCRDGHSRTATEW